jgi:hypothetical protein
LKIIENECNLQQNLNFIAMKKYILCSFLCTFFNLAFAQVETLKGKLIKKPWSKSIQSYCAGGSDYYVLVGKDKRETVLNLSAWEDAQITKKLNKEVRLKGKWETVQKENNDPMSQHPVDAPMCRTFVVTK